MRTFLLKFLLFFTVFAVLVFCLNRLAERLILDNRHYQLKDSVRSIILGHSHAEAAYIDSLLPHTVNMAQSGESYFYSYIKLRKLLEANPTIQRVMVEVSNNNLLEEMDKWTFGTMHIRYRYQKYAHLLKPAEFCLLTLKNPYAVTDALARTIKYNLDYRRTNQIPYYVYTDWGGYKKWTASKVDSLLRHQPKQDHQTTTAKNFLPHKPTKYNLVYLDSIVSLCKQSQKAVIFLRAPQHVASGNSFSDSIYFTILRKKYSSIPLIDLGNTDLPTDSYLDFEHVNFKGAIKVSKKLDSVLHQQNPLSF